MASDLKVLELWTSARLEGHLQMRNRAFLGSLANQAHGFILRQGMRDYWAAIEAREVARFETMAFLFVSIKDWWHQYLDAHRAWAAAPHHKAKPPAGEGESDAVDWSTFDFDNLKGGSGINMGASIGAAASAPTKPTGDFQELYWAPYPDYHDFARSYKIDGGVQLVGPWALYRMAACVAINDMENSPFDDWNDTEFAARIAKVLLNETPERVLAQLATKDRTEMQDKLHNWPMSMLRDVEDLDPESDRPRTLMTGGYEFLGRERSPGTDAAGTARRAQLAQAEKTLTELARTSAMQIDAYCSAAAGTDRAGKAKSLYDLEIRIQADTSNLLWHPSVPEPQMLLSGPILGYARVFGIAVWPVRNEGFSLDQSLPAGKDQNATSGMSRGLSGSHSLSHSSSESESETAGVNAGMFGETPTVGVSASWTNGSSVTDGYSDSDSWSKNVSVSVPHVGFVNYRIESRAGGVAPLIVFEMLPPFVPDRNAGQIRSFCKELVQKRIDQKLTRPEVLRGGGAEQFLDHSTELGEVKLTMPNEASIETFQQSCVFSFSRDDERFGPLLPGLNLAFRVQFIVGVGQVIRDRHEDREEGSGKENVFLRDFTFDLVVQVPRRD